MRLRIAPAKLCGYKTWESGYIFQIVTWSKGHVALREGASHSKSAPCLVWCTWVFCKWRYNVLNLSRDLTRPTYSVVIRICGWELLVVYRHYDQFCDHRHCDRCFQLVTWPHVNTCLQHYVKHFECRPLRVTKPCVWKIM